MLFNSLPFLSFAAVFFMCWPLMRRHKTTRWSFLVAASFFFYGWWDWRYLGLIIISGLIDFVVALAIGRRASGGKGWLIVSLVGNLGILFTFKQVSRILR
jgi:D-alanyl-lipoteichoic acid acyltransferase DltB (MBOAT superfamily)